MPELSKRKQTPPRPFRQPRWDGSALAGRRILLWLEQGLGDAIQFIRYAPLMKDRGATVFVECPSFMTALFSTCPGIDAVFAEGAPLPDFDLQAPLMSLPLLFGTTGSGITHDSSNQAFRMVTQAPATVACPAP